MITRQAHQQAKALQEKMLPIEVIIILNSEFSILNWNNSQFSIPNFKLPYLVFKYSRAFFANWRTLS